MLRSRQAVQRGPRWTKERDAVTTKMKLQNYHSAMFKCTKTLIHPLQPSCDAQDAAICWQVDQNGTHITTVLPPIRERLSADAKQGLMENKTYYHWNYPFPHQLWANLVRGSHRCSCNLRAVGVDSARRTRFPSTRDAPSPAVPIPMTCGGPVNPQEHHQVVLRLPRFRCRRRTDVSAATRRRYSSRI